MGGTLGTLFARAGHDVVFSQWTLFAAGRSLEVPDIS
jgi:hypothetical protein